MTKSYLVEFKIHRKMAYYSLQKIVPLHALHVLLLFLYISFPFSANLRREMTISQVLNENVNTQARI